MNENEYRHVEDLISQTKYDEALKIILELERIENLPPEDILTCLLLKIQIFDGKGEYDKSTILFEMGLKKSQELEDPLWKIDIFIAKARTKEKLLKYDESLKIVTQCEQELFSHPDIISSNPIKFKTRKAELLFLRGRNLERKNDPERALPPLLESLTIYRELTKKPQIAECLWIIGNIYGLKGEFDHAIQYYEDCLEIGKELGNKQLIATCLNNIGVIQTDEKNDPAMGLKYYKQSLQLSEELGNKDLIAFYLHNVGIASHQLGDLEQADQAFQRGLAIRKEIGNKERLAWYFNSIGNSYATLIGDLDRGLAYFQKALALFDEIKDTFGLALVYANFAYVYQQRGELDLAIEYSTKSLAKHQEIDRPLARVWPLINLGRVYIAKEDHGQAKEHIERALALSEEGGNEAVAAIAFYLLTTIALDEKQHAEARAFSQQLQQLYNQGFPSNKLRRGLIRPVKVIRQLTQLTEALILKESPSLSEKGKAQDILKVLAREPVDIIEITSTATLHLCDLLLFELKVSSGDEAVLSNVKSLLNQFKGKAQKARSYSSVVNALILQSKLNTVEGDLTKAAQLLDQAAIMAEEKGLSKLLDKVNAESNQLETQFDQWQQLIQSNAPFQKRLEQAQLEDYLLEALKLARLGSSSSSINE